MHHALLRAHSIGAGRGLESNAVSNLGLQAWHRDAPVLFDDLFAQTQGKVHSSDLPPHSVTMIMPLLEMSHDHGPTEFCMGSKHAETYQEMKMAGTLDEMDLSLEFGPRGARELREHADYWKCPERWGSGSTSCAAWWRPALPLPLPLPPLPVACWHARGKQPLRTR